MTFYQKIEALCKNHGTTVTALASELGFSRSAGTTWKHSKGLPRNSTLKKIADYFGITIDELEFGVDVPIDYTKIDTSSFRQDVYAHFLKHNGNDETAAIKAYLAFEKAEYADATRSNVNYTHSNSISISTQNQLADDEIVIYRRDGKTTVRKLSAEQLKMFERLLDAVDENSNRL